ncbi:transporter substrate-binding domain-containing protein [Bradyrhizobium sp. CCBAU 51753]|uniref:transporter substrate-binding domain-containing protein n=1 Tax=Bradyrhizobium sp. CCBAU 51753 TaxID=1325100 RepID=UPI00188A6BC5|nr:transporter substrate-binding domain-containing protein [Bradyrhizobium sp. CCBAU 51753]
MRSKSKLSLLVLLLTLTSYSLLTFAQSEAPLFASIRSASKVTVALASNPPYQFVLPSGELTGSGGDLQNMVLKSMGLPALTPIFTDWNAMIPGLQAHQFDYVGAGLSITAERCKVVIFSAPFYAAQTGIYVLPGNPKHLTSLADIARRPDIKLAAIVSGELAYAREQGVKPEQIITVPEIQAGAATVIGGRANAFITGQFTIPNPQQKGLEVVVDKQSPVFGAGMAFRKEDKQFRDAYNEHLVPLLRNGIVQKLYAKYGIANGDTQARLLANVNKASDIVPSCE